MITAAHQRFINNALPILRKTEHVVAVALGGSYIHREVMDEYSGLDFVIIIDADHYSEILPRRREIAGSIGDLLSCFTGEHIQKPELLICLYDQPLMHVDLRFMRLTDMQGRDETPIVLYDSDGALASALRSTDERKTIPDLQWFEDRFWIWLHYAAARVKRGELFDVIGSLDFLRQNVLGPLILLRNGKQPRGVRHIERDAPDEIVRLAETVATFDKADCIRALKASANLYISLRGNDYESFVPRFEAERLALRYLNETT